MVRSKNHPPPTSTAQSIDDLIDWVWYHTLSFSLTERDELIITALELIEDHGLQAEPALRRLLNIPEHIVRQPLSEAERAALKERRERARNRSAAHIPEVIQTPESGVVQSGQGAHYQGPIKYKKNNT